MNAVDLTEKKCVPCEGGAAPPLHARPDWAMLSALATALGRPAPRDLQAIRDAIIQQHPQVAPAFTQQRLVARV